MDEEQLPPRIATPVEIPVRNEAQNGGNGARLQIEPRVAIQGNVGNQGGNGMGRGGIQNPGNRAGNGGVQRVNAGPVQVNNGVLQVNVVDHTGMSGKATKKELLKVLEMQCKHQ